MIIRYRIADCTIRTLVIACVCFCCFARIINGEWIDAGGDGGSGGGNPLRDDHILTARADPAFSIPVYAFAGSAPPRAPHATDIQPIEWSALPPLDAAIRFAVRDESTASTGSNAFADTETTDIPAASKLQRPPSSPKRARAPTPPAATPPPPVTDDSAFTAAPTAGDPPPPPASSEPVDEDAAESDDSEGEKWTWTAVVKLIVRIIIEILLS